MYTYEEALGINRDVLGLGWSGNGHPDSEPKSLLWHTGAETDEIPETEWLLFPFAFKGGSAAHFVGRPKVAKTTYLLAASASITQGLDFLDRPTVKMPVVYLTEQNRRTMSRITKLAGFRARLT